MGEQLIIITIVMVIIFIVIGLDMRLKVVRYKIKGSVNLKIAHISDLHGCRYGKNMSAIVDIINDEKPDVVMYSGDIFDDDIKHKNSRILVERIRNYPSYYVNGNHEYWADDFEYIYKVLNDNGVITLEDKTAIYKKGDSEVNISGIEDPNSGKELENQLSKLYLNKDSYNILIAHRPENIKKYLEYNFDLILSGHAHGGQWRIPYLINGVYAPNQGIFPKYAGGKYKFGNKNFIVSRGLARETTIIPRFYNRPELIIIEIENK
ncbi:MAG: phosphoesterase [Clostridiales bacterium]|nr:MAG: phosphoesterase [Clostridiales bacterium]